MSFRKLLIVAGVTLVFGLAAVYYLLTSTGQPEPATSPQRNFNLVIIVSDALRQDAIGAYGGKTPTPNIDALARNGVLFENAYSTSPWTAPSCVSMFTGHYASSYGCSDPAKSSLEDLMRIYVPHSERLLAEVLKEKGYATTRAVENANAELHNNLQGFDPLVVSGTIREILSRDVLTQIENITGVPFDGSGVHVNSFVVFKQLLNIDPQANFAFLYWMLDPHQPYAPQGRFKSRIDVDVSKLSKPLEYYEGRVFQSASFNDDDRRYAKALYLAEVESVDERVGCVLSLLEHHGLLANTFVVFTADHGEQFGEHGLYGHGALGRNCHYYEGLMCVPLIIAGPGIPKGKRVGANVSLIDLMPTLKELLRLDYEDDMQGRSLLPSIQGQSPMPVPVYFDDVQQHVQVDALVDGDFKLICMEDGTFELYDVPRDPEELHDIASQDPQRVDRMYAEIERIRAENIDRKKRNVAAIDPDLLELSDEERQEIVEELRALGYIR